MATALPERFESVVNAASVDRVYGEPIDAGERTIIPVARVAFGFGGGGGPTTDGDDESEAGGWGGGGGGAARPVGALEIGPTGTRFVRFGAGRRLALVAALALVVGYLFGRRSEKRHPE